MRRLWKIGRNSCRRSWCSALLQGVFGVPLVPLVPLSQSQLDADPREQQGQARAVFGRGGNA
jgi:hypothetical protein